MKGTMKLVLITLLCSYCASWAFWQFGPPHRIGESDHARTCDNSAWAVAGNGDHVYVAYTALASGAKQVFVAASTNGGATWGKLGKLGEIGDTSHFQCNLARY